jgi:hypothetical protein
MRHYVIEVVLKVVAFSLRFDPTRAATSGATEDEFASRDFCPGI